MIDTRRTSESERPSHLQRYAPLWRSGIGLSIALLTGLFFFSPLMRVLTTPIVALGLDSLTTRLICALLFMTCAALVSAMVSRQRLRTAIGAGITYSFSYLQP